MSPPSSPLSSPLSSPRDSSPLSIRSKSPTPPCDYPSPSSSRLSESRASSKSRDVPLMSIDGPPPAKKRKLMEPKVRTTERLDLCAIDDKYAAAEEEKTREEFQLERLLKALRTKQKIVVIAGAGISVSAGSKL
jgi:NAD-dependent histone deacetylase SIR2